MALFINVSLLLSSETKTNCEQINKTPIVKIEEILNIECTRVQGKNAFNILSKNKYENAPKIKPETKSMYWQSSEYNHLKDLLKLEQIPNLYPKSKKAPKVMIAGMGPIGLESAIASIKAGSSQIIIADPREATRNQILVLEKETKDNLMELIGENNYNKLIDSGIIDYKSKTGSTSISIKHLQFILMSVIEKHANQNPESIKILSGASFSLAQDTQTGKNYPVIIDKKNNIIKVESDVYVGAEGFDSEISRAKNAVHVKLTNVKDYPAYSFALMYANDPSQNTSALIKGDNEKYKQQLTVLSTKNNFYLSGEMAPQEYEEYMQLPQEERRQYLQQKTRNKFLFKGEQMPENIQPLNGTTDVTAFPVEVSRLRKEDLVKQTDFGLAISLGDAASTPDFHTASGYNKARKQTNLLGQYLTKNISKNELIESIDETIKKQNKGSIESITGKRVTFNPDGSYNLGKEIKGQRMLTKTDKNSNIESVKNFPMVPVQSGNRLIVADDKEASKMYVAPANHALIKVEAVKDDITFVFSLLKNNGDSSLFIDSKRYLENSKIINSITNIEHFNCHRLNFNH